MKTEKEIRDEITELYGASIALNQAMEQLHKQQVETTRKMFALNQMLKDMQEDDNE